MSPRGAELMHRDACPRSIASVIKGLLAVQLTDVMRTAAIAIAMASFSSLAQADTMDLTIFPEENSGLENSRSGSVG